MRIEFDVPEDLHEILDPVPLPDMASVHYDIPTPASIPDVAAAVRKELAGSRLSEEIQPGHRIAVGVGSRGIAHLPEIVATVIQTLREAGAEPFIVPAMGSHGGATADGQKSVLEHLGVTERRVGAPIRSQMKTVLVDRLDDGTPVYVDALAAQADSITFIARVKPHTAFHGPYESGLAKMLAIGLGKQAGAATTHAAGFGRMAEMVPAMAKAVLAHAPVRFGVAVLENAHHEPFKIAVVPSDRMLTDEPALLDEAKRALARLPFETFDVLVIDRIGKDISGDGADPNVTGRYPTPYATGPPDVNKQVILDLTLATDGNANGIGTADFTTVRAARKMSLARTYPNALTSTVAGPVALPMVLSSDRLAIAAGVLTCNATAREPTLVRIPDTQRITDFQVSASMLQTLEENPHCTVVHGPRPMAFDAGGNLTDIEPEEELEPLPATVQRDSW